MPRRHVFLTFERRLTDLLFVTGFHNLAAGGIADVKQFRQKVTIPVSIEDQFGFGRFRAGVGVPDLEESGDSAIHAGDFHDGQIGIVHHVDAVLARWKLGVASVELEWDGGFNVANDLRVGFGRVNRRCKNQGEEKRKQVIPFGRLVICSEFVDNFGEHSDFFFISAAGEKTLYVGDTTQVGNAAAKEAFRVSDRK